MHTDQLSIAFWMMSLFAAPYALEREEGWSIQPWIERAVRAAPPRARA